MTDLDSLTLRARQRRRELDSLNGEMRSTLLRGKELQSQIQNLEELTQTLDRATILLNSIGEERQFKAQETIEELVTRGLQTIFDDSLSFHIVQNVRAKSSTVEFLVRTTLGDEIIETSVMDARGGGLAATIGFLLRLVVMLLDTDTKQEKVLFLDEVFAHVSDEYLEPLGQFIREVVDKTNVQIVLVTHQPQFLDFADVGYRFETKEGKTVVSKKT